MTPTRKYQGVRHFAFCSRQVQGLILEPNRAMSKRSIVKEETPIRGPSWSDAPIVVKSTGVEVRETKGLVALQKQFNDIYDQFKKGFETESHVAVDSAQASKSNDPDCDSSKKRLTSPGAFDFLEDRKN